MKTKILSLLMLLACVSFVSCSKDDDFAADDFTITDGNIRQKIVGNWEIEKFCDYAQYQGWQITYGKDLGDSKYFSVLPNGTCINDFYKDVRYRVGNNTITISCLWLVCEMSGDNFKMVISASTTDEEVNMNMEKYRSMGYNCRIERQDYMTFEVKEMNKDGFYFEGEAAIFPIKLWIKKSN